MTQPTDDSTGLPPLDEVDPAFTMATMVFVVTEGVMQSPMDDKAVACRYLNVRGLQPGEHGPEWGQVHIAIPVEEIPRLVARLTEPM